MDSYHTAVGAYYNEDARLGFESRALANQSLERIRADFRSYVTRYNPRSALEIGCGPGFDALWFAQTFPTAKLTAIDVSDEMVAMTKARTVTHQNVTATQATEQNLNTLDDKPFDMVYVFFGALNTVPNLTRAAENIHDVMAPGGVAVLTFVNKWYLRELIVNLLKLKPRTAFARLRAVWGGYSTNRHLESRCYSHAYIRACFGQFTEAAHQGYSIVFPAWYNDHKLASNPKKADRLWRIDRWLNRTFLWPFGEYTLFVFQKPVSQ